MTQQSTVMSIFQPCSTIHEHIPAIFRKVSEKKGRYTFMFEFIGFGYGPFWPTSTIVPLLRGGDKTLYGECFAAIFFLLMTASQRLLCTLLVIVIAPMLLLGCFYDMRNA